MWDDDMLKFTRLKQPPNKMTFTMPKLYKWLIERCVGKTLNLFAGKVLLTGVDEVRVDVDPDMPCIHYLMDAYDFVMYATKLGLKFDTIILDPPYNVRKAREKYGDRWIGSFTKIKDVLPQIMNNSCRVITFGYSSVGMSESRGFELTEICLICHSGDYSDTIVTVEERCQVTSQ
jgi:hypothetical protein